MADLQDGETTEMQGSGAKPYVLKNTGGVYSCSCLAWRNQSIAIEKRTCKHLRKFRGDAAEEARVGGALPQCPGKSPAETNAEESSGPPLLLAESWDNAADLSDWWMSEKLDGVRAYWDGKQFLSRQGNTKRTANLLSSAWRLRSLKEKMGCERLWRSFPPVQKLGCNERSVRRLEIRQAHKARSCSLVPTHW
jgi:hypothetical protein